MPDPERPDYRTAADKISVERLEVTVSDSRKPAGSGEPAAADEKSGWWQKFQSAFGRGWKKIPTPIRKPLAVVIAAVLLAIGGVLALLPGPFTIPFVIAAFAVLSAEFEWANRLFKWGEKKLIIIKDWLLSIPRVLLVLMFFAVIAAFGGSFYWYFFVRT